MTVRLAVVLALLAVCGFATTAPEARASTISLAGSNKFLYNAVNGEDNDLTVSLSAGVYTFTEDVGVTITPLLAPCSAPSNVVTCTAAGITELEINVFDMDDQAVVTAPTRTIFRGGLGDDFLAGGAGNDQLNGDETNVGGGNDTLLGGPGDDEVNGEPPPFTGPGGGTNTLDGGPGADFVNGGSGPDSVSGGDDADRAFGYAGADVVDGGRGGDLVVGGDANDIIRGGEGDDRLGDDATVSNNFPPDRGSDAFDGGPGDDLLRPGLGPTQGIADDDSLSGGSGRDTVSYQQRLAAVTVSLDGAAGDGVPGESDNVRLDVERLVGGTVADRLSGGPNGTRSTGSRAQTRSRAGRGPTISTAGRSTLRATT